MKKHNSPPADPTPKCVYFSQNKAVCSPQSKPWPRLTDRGRQTTTPKPAPSAGGEHTNGLQEHAQIRMNYWIWLNLTFFASTKSGPPRRNPQGRPVQPSPSAHEGFGCWSHGAGLVQASPSLHSQQEPFNNHWFIGILGHLSPLFFLLTEIRAL